MFKRVRFVETVTVQNGTGMEPGPTYRAGEVREFPDRSAEYWVNRRAAVFDQAAVTETGDPVIQEPPRTKTTTVELSAMTVAELSDHAKKLGIDLGTLSRKEEIIAKIKADVAAAGGDAPSGDDAVDLDSMTVAQLREYAEAGKIDLGTVTRKQEIIDLIRAAARG